MLYHMEHRYLPSDGLKRDHKRMFAFLEIDAEGQPLYPEVSLTAYTETPPAWDEEVYMQAGFGHSQLLAWETTNVESAIENIASEQDTSYIFDTYSYDKDTRMKHEGSHTSGKFHAWDETDSFAGAEGTDALEMETVSLAVVGNAIVAAYAKPLDATYTPEWYVAMIDKSSGAIIREWPLPSKPAVNGTIINQNNTASFSFEVL